MAQNGRSDVKYCMLRAFVHLCWILVKLRLNSGPFWVSNMYTQHPNKIVIKVWPHIKHTYQYTRNHQMEACLLLRSCWVYRPHHWHAEVSHVFSWDLGVSEHTEVKGQYLSLFVKILYFHYNIQRWPSIYEWYLQKIKRWRGLWEERSLLRLAHN